MYNNVCRCGKNVSNITKAYCFHYCWAKNYAYLCTFYALNFKGRIPFRNTYRRLHLQWQCFSGSSQQEMTLTNSNMDFLVIPNSPLWVDPVSTNFFMQQSWSYHPTSVWFKKKFLVWPFQQYQIQFCDFLSTKIGGTPGLCKPSDLSYVGCCWNSLYCPWSVCDFIWRILELFWYHFVECNWVYSCVVIQWRAWWSSYTWLVVVDVFLNPVPTEFDDDC